MLILGTGSILEGRNVVPGTYYLAGLCPSYLLSTIVSTIVGLYPGIPSAAAYG